MVERLTTKQLDEHFSKMPEAMRPHRVERSFFLACFIISHYLGKQWIEDHVIKPVDNNGIFAIDEGDFQNGKTLVQVYRAADLAETLVNLQHIDGFLECIVRMKSARNPEPSLAEMHIGKALYTNDWMFRFIKPIGKLGSDYDFEINYNDIILCGDAKCNLTSTELSSRTITNTLTSSRRQLPAGLPGAFFFKVPQRWAQEPDFEAILTKGANDFFAKGSQRVVSVAFYTDPLTWAEGLLSLRHQFYEVLNPRHGFGDAFDWRLFHRWRPSPPRKNLMPDKWFNLFTYPTPAIELADDAW